MLGVAIRQHIVVFLSLVVLAFDLVYLVQYFQ